MNQKSDDKQLLSYCQDLIKIRSYSGEEDRLAESLNEEARRLGFDEVWRDDYGNAVCRLSGTAPGTRRSILLDGHMDTVPVCSEQWSHPPFGGVIDGGRLYGRGAADMKCSLGAMMYAAARLIPHKETLCGDVYISGTVNEEQFEGVAFREVLNGVKPQLVVVGEASEMALKIGQRGRAEIVLEAFGKSAHSSNPQCGKNAVYTMMDYMRLLRDSDVPQEDFLGFGISELTDIASKPYPGASVVPYYCAATLDRRLLCGETRETVMAGYSEIYEMLKKTDREADMKISIAYGNEKTCTGKAIAGDRFFPAWCMEETDEAVRVAKQAIAEAGLPVRISHYSFCTNGSMSAGEMGIPTIGFGPGQECLAHIDDEYVGTDELLRACRVYTGIIRGWLNPDGRV
jgi:putative selenium metabolism hydrolase